MNFRLAHDQVVLPETTANLWARLIVPDNVKLIISSQFFLVLSWEVLTKHFMTGPMGNSGFCFPETLNVSWHDQVVTGIVKRFSGGTTAGVVIMERWQLYM